MSPFPVLLEKMKLFLTVLVLASLFAPVLMQGAEESRQDAWKRVFRFRNLAEPCFLRIANNSEIFEEYRRLIQTLDKLTADPTTPPMDLEKAKSEAEAYREKYGNGILCHPKYVCAENGPDFPTRSVDGQTFGLGVPVTADVDPSEDVVLSFEGPIGHCECRPGFSYEIDVFFNYKCRVEAGYSCHPENRFYACAWPASCVPADGVVPLELGGGFGELIKEYPSHVCRCPPDTDCPRDTAGQVLTRNWKLLLAQNPKRSGTTSPPSLQLSFPFSFYLLLIIILL